MDAKARADCIKEIDLLKVIFSFFSGMNIFWHYNFDNKRSNELSDICNFVHVITYE